MDIQDIPVSDQLQDFVKSRVESGEFNSENEYLHSLIHDDFEQYQEDKVLLDLIREGERSGVSDRTLPDIIRDIKARMKADGTL